jgi:hypothetical protein
MHCVSRQPVNALREDFAWFASAGDALAFARVYAQSHIQLDVRVWACSQAPRMTFAELEMAS